MFLKSHRPGASSAAQGLRRGADVGAHRELRSGGCVPVPWVARCSSRGTQGHRAGCLPHYFFEPVHVFDPDCKNPTAVGFLLFSSIKFRIPE